MARPHWFDGTALCVGAAMPDLAYPFGSWLSRQSHTALGTVVWAIPVALAICWVLRWRAASGIFAHLPDAGALRLRSLRVIGTRRPAMRVTLWSAAVGAVSHVVIDGFTHSRRWGARWLGIGEVLGTWPIRGEYSVAAVLQYVGHIGGSLVAVALLISIARHELLERWYGEDSVAAARAARPNGRRRLVFGMVFGIAVVGPVGAALAVGRDPVFVAVASIVGGALVAGALVGEPMVRRSPASGGPDDGGGRAVDVAVGRDPAGH